MLPKAGAYITDHLSFVGIAIHFYASIAIASTIPKPEKSKFKNTKNTFSP